MKRRLVAMARARKSQSPAPGTPAGSEVLGIVWLLVQFF